MQANNHLAHPPVDEESSGKNSLGDQPLSDKPRWHDWLLIAVPTLVLVGVYFMSPNFDIGDPQAVQPYPPGGDYLQEYVGGLMVFGHVPGDSAGPGTLYDVDVFKRVQHDPVVTGFRWDNDQYFPPVYPPFWYAAVSPLSALPYAAAMKGWAFLMTVCLMVSLVLIYRCTDAPLALLLLLCFSTPVIHSISSGQKGTLLLLIFTATLVLLNRGRWGWSGIVFALSLFKPYLGICVGLLMLISGRWRWAATTLMTVAAIAVGSWLRWPQLCQGYLEVCLGFGDYVQSGGYELEKSYSLWSGWQLLVSDGMTAKMLTLISSLTVLTGALFFLRPKTTAGVVTESTDSLVQQTRIDTQGHRLELGFAVMVLVTAITAPHFYYYDLTMLILPAAIFAGHATRQRFDRRNWLPTVLIATAMFASGPIEKIAESTNVSLGALLLLAAIVCGILVVNRSQPERSND